MSQFIIIKGANENNLKNIDVKIHRNAITAVTGVSGSGKSSLILETLQKESIRQLFEIMGNQEQLRKPKVESITGLSPAVSIDQYITNRNPRSTVGTYTEVFRYIRWLYLQVGQIKCENCSRLSKRYNSTASHQCDNCGSPIKQYKMADFSFNTPSGACKKCNGIGTIYAVNIKTVIDENLSVSDGAVKYWGKNEIKYCLPMMENAGKHYGFSFCKENKVKDYDEAAKAFLYYGYFDRRFVKYFPDKKPPEQRHSGFNGFVTDLLHRYENSPNVEAGEEGLSPYMIHTECDECHGSRLSNELLAVTVNGTTINEINKYSLIELNGWLSDYKTSVINTEEETIVSEILDIMLKKTDNLIWLGLEYLSLNRSVVTLSYGEKQRIRIANLLGSTLTDMIYIFDEPTIGLHPSDTDKIINAIKSIKDMGNTIIIIEHDVDVIKQADYIIEIGPAAGNDGGQLIFEGKAQDIIFSDDSIIKHYMNNKKYPLFNEKKSENNKYISIEHAQKHNIKDLSAKIMLNQFNVITGVSGSGKSTLIFDILLNAAQKSDNYLGEKTIIQGLEQIDNTIFLSQNAVAKSYRSNIATYTDIYTDIRKIFEAQPETKQLNLDKSHFSFNVKGGRCEECEGTGIAEINMVLMPPIQITCPVCSGNRFNDDVLKVKYKGYTISDILNMTCKKAIEIFESNKIIRVLKTIENIGLGYLLIGHSLKQLSGGELQRLKLVKELSVKKSGNNLYIFDEPTTGLHPRDVERLLEIFKQLISMGHTLIIIEHNLDVMLHADHIIDLGPGGGDKGGELIYQGCVSGLINTENSATGKSLRSYLT